MLKFAFKDVSTKNSEPTYWTILFVMLKICLNKIPECLKMTTFKIVFTFDVFLVLKPQCTAKWHVFYIRNRHISVSSFVYKYDQWPHDSYMTGRAGVREADVVWFGRWPEPWNFKTSHFQIIYLFPSRISALFLLHTKTVDAILLTTKVAR
jgi:hypothetical protein